MRNILYRLVLSTKHVREILEEICLPIKIKMIRWSGEILLNSNFHFDSGDNTECTLCFSSCCACGFFSFFVAS